MEKQKLLFFYLNTGAGHRNTINSISKHISYDDNFECIKIDALSQSNKFVKFLLQDFYNKIQNKFKFLFEILYFINKNKFNVYISNFFVYLILKNKIKKFIEKEKPNKIISAHFFLNKPIKNILKELKLNIPFVTIVTDPFTVPLLWFTENKQKFIVYSESAKKIALKMGVNDSNIKISSIIVDEKYSKTLSVEDIKLKKNDLKIDLNKKVILMLSGGGGFPNGVNIFKSIIKYNNDYEIIIVCGSNKKMQEKFLKILKAKKINNIKIFGFVDFVYDLINVSDVVITKGGPASIMEILLLKKIPIIASYIWEQEKGNVDFVVKNNLGVYEKNPIKLVSVMKNILNNEKQKIYLENIKKQKLKNDLFKISEYIKKID